ncbi:MAG: hypothetical protein HY594_00105, partial [Candidatus Omnitrophica bacterium]|nr:hypothetical protein [Candidatus Omnitrophota bacterium]
AQQRHRLEVIGWVLAANLAFIAVVPWQRHFRYLIHLLPLFYIFETAFLWVWLRNRPLILASVVSLLLLTDFLHYSAPYVIAQAVPQLRAKIEREHGGVRPEQLFLKYGYELTHDYRGPLSGIIGELQRAARPGETAKIPYDDHAVIFYTGLRVEDLNRFTNPTTPDWIIPRRDWIPSDFSNSDYFKKIGQDYEKIETDAPDIVWENRPDPGYHKFRTVEHAPRVVLYHRKRTQAPD